MKATISRKKLHSRAANPCTSTAFYLSPKTGTAVVTSQPVTLSWNTSSVYASCLGNPQKIDIILTSPDTSGGQVHTISPISFADGTYTQSLEPKWWNGAQNSSIQLRVNIVSTGTPVWNSTIASGPVLNVTVDQAIATDNSSTADPNLSTGNGSALSGGLPKGSVAAAVLLPILIIAAGVAVYIKISRKKQEEKRKRWSQAMDARMSRISGDWKSITAQGAQVAMRDSQMRMSTVFATEMDVQMRPSFQRSAERLSVADRLSVAMQAQPRPSVETVASAYTRTTRPSMNAERQSRISFATDVNASKDRLSTYSVGRQSRAFHIGTLPPVPALPRSSTYENRPFSTMTVNTGAEAMDEHHMSPTQADGPVVLSNEDIHHMDIGPALSIMRMGNPAMASSDDLLLSPPLATAYAPPMSPLGASGSAPPLSPIGMGHMPMMPTMSFGSPDEMVKKYAELRAKAGSPPMTMTMPVPPSPVYSATPSSTTTPSFTAAGMRNLTGDPSLEVNPYAEDAYIVNHPYRNAGPSS